MKKFKVFENHYFVGIIVDQTKALFKTAVMLSEETSKIVEKYVGGDDNA